MSEQTKTYKVKLSKKFHTQVASGTRLTNLRHSRGGVTLSSPDNTEQVVDLTKDQVEAIKNDPAFEITSVKSNEGSDPTKGAGGSASKPAANTDESQGGAPETETTTPPQGDGSGDSESEGSSEGEQSQDDGTQTPPTSTESNSEGQGSDEDEGSQDGPVVLDEAALKALKNGNRNGAVAAATERGVEVTDQDTKAQIVDKIAAKQAEAQE